MSLLMDLLKKVGEKEKSSQVPPSIKPPFREDRGKQSLKLFLLVVLMGFFSVVAYIVTIYLVGEKVDSKRLEEQILALKESVEKSTPQRDRMSAAPQQESTAQNQPVAEDIEEEEEPSTLDGGMDLTQQEARSNQVNSQKVKPPRKESAIVERPNSEGEEEIPEKERLQAKMSNVNPELEVGKIVKDVVPTGPQPQGTSFIPEYANSLYYGDYYFKKGELRRSMEFYEKAYSIRRSENVANNLITIYMRLGLRSKAQAILKNHPTEKIYYTYIMELANNFGTDEALEEIGSFIPSDRRGYLYFARGYLRERMGDIEGASKDYRTAYSKDPANPYFAFNHARMLERSGRLKEAYRVYLALNLQNLEPKIQDIVRDRLKELRSLGIGR